MASTSKTRSKQRSKSRLKQRNPKGTSTPIPLGKGGFQFGPTIPKPTLDELSKTEMDFLRKLMSGKKKFMF